MKIGVDVVDLQRFARVVGNFPSFVRQNFTPNELEQADTYSGGRRIQFLAGRFAAKEATLKALGVGLDRGIPLTDIETLRTSSGAPQATVRGAAKAAAHQMGLSKVEVSISHDGGVVVAFVVMS